MVKILKINNLRGGYKADTDILRGVSMEMKHGEAIGIFGLNGSGKSTLGKAIMNMLPYRMGDIEFNGENITKLTTSQLSHCGISIMQQGGKVFQTLSVWENLQLAIFNRPVKTIDALRDIIPMLQLSQKELKRMMADKLSGGQKHQLSLAMTLATNPQLVILDEPSAGLAPKAVDEMYSMLQTAREQLGITIILIEQNIARAMYYCDRYLVMDQGHFTNKKIKNFEIFEEMLFNK